jgi:hypothetical protein
LKNHIQEQRYINRIEKWQETKKNPHENQAVEALTRADWWSVQKVGTVVLLKKLLSFEKCSRTYNLPESRSDRSEVRLGKSYPFVNLAQRYINFTNISSANSFFIKLN